MSAVLCEGVVRTRMEGRVEKNHLVCALQWRRLEGAMRVAIDKRRFYKPSRLLSFQLPVGTLARYVR